MWTAPCASHSGTWHTWVETMSGAGNGRPGTETEGDCTGSWCQRPGWTGSQASTRPAPRVGGTSCLQLMPLILAKPGPPVTHIQEKEDTGLPPVLGVNETQKKWEPGWEWAGNVMPMGI